jgi:hypothetical protein
MMYRLADHRGMPLGVFDSLEEAQSLVPEVDRWDEVATGLWNGWRPDGSFFDRPHFTIKACA